jgi:diguanylate cyclase
MNPINTPAVNFSEWNSKILSAYWAIFALTLFNEIAALLYLAPHNEGSILTEYSFVHIIKPSLSIVIVLLVSQIINSIPHRYNNDVVLGAGSLIPGILVYFHASLDGVQYFFMIPILVSVFYFQPSKLLISFGVNVSLFILLYLLHPVLKVKIDVIEFMTTIVTLFCGLIISYGIMARGAEIQQNLRRTMSEQQDLLVKSILMDKLSKIDALTELYNHKTFHEYLDKLIDQCDHHKLKLHLAVMDIDNFKKINDTYGHWVGDLILRSVSQTIRSTVSMDDFSARYGGEEFAVIFTDKTQEEVLGITESIRESIAGTHHPELNGGSVTISIGLKEYSPGSGKEWLFRGADEALYTAKRSGKNRTILHEPEIAVTHS